VLIYKAANKTRAVAKIILPIINNIRSRVNLHYIVEDADWSIKHDGKMITINISNLTSRITTTHYGIRDSIVHYGSIGTFLGINRVKFPHKSNKIIVTWFHVEEDDERLESLPNAIGIVDIWHTSCRKTKDKLVELGVEKKKIIIIPLGVDLKYFNNPSKKEKKFLREKFKIPKNKIVIGSFQKDGTGWGQGLSPKLIKGPDIFCDVVEKLASRYNIFVLLTGPSRGYVKARLDAVKIPYKHDFLENPNEVSEYFKAIDLYMVTSRNEGGPKAILESMACGVPLVSTKVGMASDVIKNNKNGCLVDVEDRNAIFKNACNIIDNTELQNILISNGLATAKDYEWSNIANQYYEKMYKELL
jgi:glycosyltransferase involved in cell wall biosynthesis